MIKVIDNEYIQDGVAVKERTMYVFGIIVYYGRYTTRNSAIVNSLKSENNNKNTVIGFNNED